MLNDSPGRMQRAKASRTDCVLALNHLCRASVDLCRRRPGFLLGSHSCSCLAPRRLLGLARGGAGAMALRFDYPQGGERERVPAGKTQGRAKASQ